MIVRLNNLSVRAPVLDDARAVTALLVACDQMEARIADPTEDRVVRAWQAPGFQLATDAWVIVSHKGLIIGYADVRHCEGARFVAGLHVHPEYRGRGIGTLLTWLVEERARELMDRVEPGMRVTLCLTVSSRDQGAYRLLEREGYVSVRHFWRLVVEMDEEPGASFEEFYQHGKLKLDLVVDAQHLMGTTRVARRTGIYVAHQYNVFEKELRAGQSEVFEKELEPCTSL